MGKGKEKKEEGEGNEKGKVKGRWKKRYLKESWTHGRTDARTDTQVILYSMLCTALDRQQQFCVSEPVSKPDHVCTAHY